MLVSGFEKMVQANRFTVQGMRPLWAAAVITSLECAAGFGSGTGRLTETERSMLLCVVHLIRGRLDEPDGVNLAAGAAAEILAGALQICQDTPELDGYQPGLRGLAARWRRDLDAFHGTPAAPPGSSPGTPPA